MFWYVFILLVSLLLRGNEAAATGSADLKMDFKQSVTQRLEALEEELTHYKEKVDTLEAKLEGCPCYKQDHTPRGTRELGDMDGLLGDTHRHIVERDSDGQETGNSRTKRQFDQLIRQSVEGLLKNALQCQENETIGVECSLKPGPKGDKGDEGMRGLKGDKGDTGEKGDTGSTGSTGEKGEKGQLGYPGYKGCQGEPGAIGAVGPQGVKGEVGATGAKGEKGSFGGPKGDTGPIGAAGPQGVKGDVGATGAKGEKGSFGGPKGDTGPIGAAGPQGVKGDTGGKGQKGDINSGSTYIRWGRDDCPYGAVALYSGRVAGSKHNTKGGTSDHLCLPDRPRYESSYIEASSRLYGVEYQRWPTSSPRAHYDNMPCVVCYIATRSAMFVQQASYLCPSGWSREYHGYMMSEIAYRDRQHKSTICVDVNAEVIPGSGTDTNPSLTYLMSVECTSSELLCPPYVDGRILSCAVCTK